MDTSIAFTALGVSIVSLVISIYFWTTTFRPIVTAMVKTREAGNKLIALSLEIRNSGSLPAKNIRLIPNKNGLKGAYGDEATLENKRQALACFKKEVTILILHNDSVVDCPFGYIKEGGKGFWKYKANVPITIEYEGWLGWLGKWKLFPRYYTEHQEIQIRSSRSFTDNEWGELSNKNTSQKVPLNNCHKKLNQLVPSAKVSHSLD